MARLQRILLIPLLLALTACQMANNREAHRAQAMLDEAELLIEARELDKAKDKATTALGKLDAVTKSDKKNIDHQLLAVRAHFTIFMADNLLTLESAEVRRRSLVRFPEPQQLVGREKHLKVAERELKLLANGDQELAIDQSAFVHGMLGAILRLDDQKLGEADREYGKAISGYQKELAEAKANPPKIGSNDGLVARLDNQIRSLHMAQAEIKLLAEEWPEALTRLQKAMAGEDLKYFAVQFEILKSSMEDAQLQIDDSFKMRQGSREDNLRQALDAKRKKKPSKRDELGSTNPYRMQLTQAKVEMTDAVNNLIYRMICYHQLKKRQQFEEARVILEEFYPDLARDFEIQLRRYG